MANKAHARIAVIENDMALVAQGKVAHADLEGLLLCKCGRPVFTLADAERMWTDLAAIELALAASTKYLARKRA